MKGYLIIIIPFLLFACNNENKSANGELSDDSTDSCKNAVKFENLLMTEKMVPPGYSGDLNNYWGTDTTKLDIKHVFENGNLVKSYFYYENGNVQEEYEYKCKSIHGHVKIYHENGKLAQIMPYRYGKKEGTAFIYDSLGNTTREALFENDKMIEEQVMSYDEYK